MFEGKKRATPNSNAKTAPSDAINAALIELKTAMIVFCALQTCRCYTNAVNDVLLKGVPP